MKALAAFDPEFRRLYAELFYDVWNRGRPVAFNTCRDFGIDPIDAEVLVDDVFIPTWIELHQKWLQNSSMTINYSYVKQLLVWRTQDKCRKYLRGQLEEVPFDEEENYHGDNGEELPNFPEDFKAKLFSPQTFEQEFPQWLKDRHCTYLNPLLKVWIVVEGYEKLPPKLNERNPERSRRIASELKLNLADKKDSNKFHGYNKRLWRDEGPVFFYMWILHETFTLWSPAQHRMFRDSLSQDVSVIWDCFVESLTKHQGLSLGQHHKDIARISYMKEESLDEFVIRFGKWKWNDIVV